LRSAQRVSDTRTARRGAEVPTSRVVAPPAAGALPSFAPRLVAPDRATRAVAAPLVPFVTVTADDAACPAVSNARAVTVCLPLERPLVRVRTVYGACVSVATRVESTQNSTRATP
jgi:hypothetical protein